MQARVQMQTMSLHVQACSLAVADALASHGCDAELRMIWRVVSIH